MKALTSMQRGASWYNNALVGQKGSVILTEWKRTHGPEARRTAAAMAKRSYAGAQQGRTVADWVANSTSADSELWTSLRTLRNRSRQLVRDNEYAAHVINRVIPNNVVGQGIKFQAQVQMRRGNKLDEKTNDLIEKEWTRWTRADSCHVAGKLAFSDIERMITRSAAESGEIMVRLVKQRFGNSKVPLGLELIEADQLVDNYSGRTNEGNEVRMGVEVDQWQRPVAYWLYPRHPGDYSFSAQPAQNTWIRVPASEIIHVAMFDRPMQTRGVPWMHAALLKLRHIGGTEEAEIVAARASASVMGFIQSTEPDISIGEPSTDADGVEDNEQVYDMSPGIIKSLAPGETFQGFNPARPNTGLIDFLRYLLRCFAVGTGISYESVSGDYSQSNYSSTRLAQLSERDMWRVMQAWLIRTFHQRVYEAWLELAVLSDVLPLPGYEAAPEIYQAVRWMPRGWDWVDPIKEVAAAKAAVRSGFQTVADVIAGKGGDIEDVFRQRQREIELAAQYGLTLETDPAMVDEKGVAQTVEPGDAGVSAGEGEEAAPGKKPKQEDAAEARERAWQDN